MRTKREEERRSRTWDIVMTIATALIVIIAAFFIIKLFTKNPLEGTWKQVDSDIELIVKGNDSVTVSVTPVMEGEKVSIRMNYTMDKEAKTITFHPDDSSLKKAVENSDGQYTESGLQSEVSILTNSFSYNKEKQQLTLTEVEYGDTLVFDRK